MRPVVTGQDQTCTLRAGAAIFSYSNPALRMPSRNLAIGPAV
jgi:hypothetical protein